jgi:hypothetical protein
LGPRLAGERYALTDFRLVRARGRHVDEIALDEIGDVDTVESSTDRALGTSTLVVQRRDRRGSLRLTSVRRGAQLAAFIELLAADPRAPRDPDAARAALAWSPPPPALDLRSALAGFLAVLTMIFVVVIGLHGKTVVVTYAPDDAIAPNGAKRSEPEVIAFMEREVMPWARETLGRLKGGADRISCATCHGGRGEESGWQMPAVAALPQPDVKERAWELYSWTMDAQMRNAIYGYLAESDNQAKAAFMREVVVPGMARLLHRPAYDFTKPYEYNRSQHALGCYHCHRVQ